MKSLHTITANITIWCWHSVWGANGHAISDDWHLYEIERGTPPPLGSPDWRRKGWLPFFEAGMHAKSAEERLTPLCGRLKSKSRFPDVRPVTRSRWWEENIIQIRGCARCRTVAEQRGITGIFTNDAQANDPWNHVPWDDRPTTADPVTGL